MSTADSDESSAVGLDAQADDMALLRRYVDLGSQDAFNQLVSRHLSWVHATCRKGLRDRHMAEDAAQAVFIILARRAAAIPPQTRLSGWLFNTARFVIKDAKKQETRYRRRENVAREMSAGRLSPVREPVDLQTQAVLDDALATLTERDRLALLMHFYEGLSLQEMADSLGITKDGAKKRVARALSRLRSRMARNGKAAATVAVLGVLLRSRGAEAAPLGLAQTVSSSATVPGVATSVAKWMAQRAMSTSAGASRRLLRALVAFELMTVATLVTVGTISARRHVAVTAVAKTSVAQVQPATATPAAAVKPPAPAKSTVVAAAEPVTPYRSGAFDPEPRVEPLPPFKDEPKPMTRSASEGGGSGLVASSGGPAGVSTFTTPAYGSARVGGAMPQQLPIPQSSPRGAAPTLASIAPGSSGSSGSRGSASAVASSETPSKTRTPAEPPVTEPPVVGGKGHKSWPDLPPVGPLPPEPMPLVHDPLPRPGHVDERPPKVEVPPPPPAKEQAAKAGEYPKQEYFERGKRIVALAMGDGNRDYEFGFGFGRGHGRVRRGIFEENVAHDVTARGRSRRTGAPASTIDVPRFEPAEVAADVAAGTGADCPPVTAGKSLDPVAIATASRENDSFTTPFVRAFEEKRIMAYEAAAPAAADYAFSASPTLSAEAVPEPSGLAVVAVAGLCGVLARGTRRR